MRILHIIGWLAPRYGGPVTVLPGLCDALSGRGHHVEIVTTDVDGDGRLRVLLGQPTEWARATATFHALSAPSWYLTSWSMLSDLRNRVAGFDVVHIHTLYRFHGVAAAVTARRRGVPYVIQAHGSLNPRHRARRRRAKDLYHAFIEDPIIRGASAFIATSDREAQAIRDLGYSVPLWVIPNGIDAAALRVSTPADGFPSSRVEAGHRVVTFLGRISAGKGVPLLVDAFRMAAATIPGARLIIAGSDDEGIGRGLASAVAEVGLSDRVSFVGAVTGVAKRALLQRSDVFVLPSAEESFGVAVAEAMAVGCPVVVTPGVAIEDVIRAVGAGLVVERNASAIAGAIATILDDPSRSAAMGEAGRRAVDERFSWPIVSGQMEAMYKAVIGASNGRRTRLPLLRSTAGESSAPAFRCPSCHGGLASDAPEDALSCQVCGWKGSASSGIPLLVSDPGMADHDEIDDHHGQAHKAAQSAHFDHVEEAEFEIDRPHGTPRLYGFMLAEKFRRSTQPIREPLVGASALSVCGGSGMDAEFLSRTGAAVTSSDLSLGAAKRARARSERYGLEIKSIVADVEQLPFADQSVDVVAVHDGLHHLGDPYAGLSEMARVARHWVVVTEPASSSVTRLAVRLGLALETEGAGNRVARMDPSDVTAFLEARGYVVLRAERYAMYYPHHPGAVFSLLSRPFVFPIVRAGWRLANAFVGRFGNKMVVVAERDPSTTTDSRPSSRSK